MELGMLLSSVPKINGLNYKEIKFAGNHLFDIEEEQKELYEKVKPYISYNEEYSMIRVKLIEEVGYWRNATQIHNWFVETLHNGIDEPSFTVEVTKNDVEILYIDCLEELIRRCPDPDDLIPPRPKCFSGFDYNDLYYSQISETVSLLEDLLQNFNFESRYLMYHCYIPYN